MLFTTLFLETLGGEHKDGRSTKDTPVSFSSSSMLDKPASKDT